jgi:hypothetical protein
MRHPNEHALLRYLASALTENGQIEVDTHLADCSVCAQSVRALHYLQDNFDVLLSSWTAVEHGHVYWQWRIAKAMTEITDTLLSRERLKTLYEQVRRGMGLCIKILLDHSKRIAILVKQELPLGYEFKLYPAYISVGLPEEEAKLKDHLEKGSGFFTENNTEGAIRELLEARELHAESVLSAASELIHDGRLIADARVDSARKSIDIKLWPEQDFTFSAVAILLPEDPEGKGRVAVFQPVENEPFMLAEFGQLGDCAYSLWIGFEKISE